MSNYTQLKTILAIKTGKAREDQLARVRAELVLRKAEYLANKK